MTCFHCGSGRIIDVQSKCDDRCGISLGEIEVNGYVPYDLGIGGGDYVEFKLCLECGQQQGTFPRPLTRMEETVETPEEFPQE